MAEAGESVVDSQPRMLGGMNVLEVFRNGGARALSDLAVCLLRLLEVLEWSGRERHLAEAMPHFIPNLDLEGFRETLANLNLGSRPVRVRHDRIDSNHIPCLFVPDNQAAPVRIIIEADVDGYKIYDGTYRFFRRASGKGINGTAYVVKPVDRAAQEKKSRGQTWAAPLIGRFRALVGQVLVLTLLFNVLSLAMPLFMMSIYDRVIPSASINQLLFLFSGVIFAIAMETALRRLRVRAMAYLAGRIDYLVGRSAFERILFLPLAMLEHEPLGAQLSQLQEFESLREFFAGPLGEALLDLPFVVIYLAVIAALGGWLVLVPVVAGLAYVISGLAISAVTKHFAAAGNEQRAEQQKFLIQAVSGMRAIKFAGSEDVWLRRYPAHPWP